MWPDWAPLYGEPDFSQGDRPVMAAIEPAADGSGRHRHGHAALAPGMARDPVCGMSVDPATARHRTEHAGTHYFFCGARCLERFNAAPAQFVGPVPSPAPAMPATGQWTCPMHPQIVRDGPGSCPICGMALEPMMPGDEEGENPELRDMTKRFWVALALSVPLLAMAMGWHSPSPVAVWTELVLATPAVVWGGAPFFQRGYESVKNRSLNMFTLIALGTGVAYLYSLVASLVPGIFPASLRDSMGGIPLYFEAAAV